MRTFTETLSTASLSVTSAEQDVVWPVETLVHVMFSMIGRCVSMRNVTVLLPTLPLESIAEIVMLCDPEVNVRLVFWHEMRVVLAPPSRVYAHQEIGDASLTV